MDTSLRPLTLGEILDRTAQLYRSNFLLFAGIFSFYAGVALVFNLVQLAIGHILAARHAVHLLWLVYVTGGIEMICLFLLVGASVAAISRAVASVHLGEPVSIRGAYATTLPQLGRYLWLSTLTGLRAWWAFVALYAGLIIALVALKAPQAAKAAGQSTAAQQQAVMVMGIAFLAFGVLLIPVAVYTIWMTIRYSLAITASVVENIKARAAIRRSIDLSKGARWRIFVLLLLVIVIKLGVVGVTQSFIVIAAIQHHGKLDIPVWMNVLSQCISFCTTTFLGPIGAAGLTLFYFDQRVRKEGFDIEWMMQAAGLEPGTAQLNEAATGAPVSLADASAEPVHE